MKKNYLGMLQIYVISYFTATFPDINHPGQFDSSIWFHQIMLKLEIFSKELFLIAGFNSYGFFCLGYLNSKTVKDLKERI